MSTSTLPNTVGIGLKAQHYQCILEQRPTLGWFEIHPENYMGNGGLPHKYLTQIAQHYPLSMHGVGMSLGSTEGIASEHLNALKNVVERYQPAQVSEHLAWSHHQGIYLNDLLPLPYTRESLAIITRNIHHVQDVLARPILIENPSAYLGFNHNDMDEPHFLSEIVKTTGCGLLLDVNNVYVSATNQGFDPTHYIEQLPLDAVGEIHLAGHTTQHVEGDILLIDDHGSAVTDDVWALYEVTLQKLKRPTAVLIEWDTNIPALDVLLHEASLAQQLLLTHNSHQGVA